jgi:hypothetical protein
LPRRHGTPWCIPVQHASRRKIEPADARFAVSQTHRLSEVDDPDLAQQSLRFTRDLVADLHVACRSPLWSARVMDVLRVTDAFLASRSPRYAGIAR